MPEKVEPNILIVDDDAVIQRNIEKILTKNGYTATIASDSTEIINLLEQHSFDLILLDMMMPDWTGVFSKQAGLSVLKEIRERDWNMPVIILTASDSVETAVFSMKFGATDYLEKGNISSKEFIEKIEHALQAAHTLPNGIDSLPATSHNQKWKDWLIERVIGLQDEIIGAAVVGLVAIIFKITSESPYATTYAVIASIVFIILLFIMYIAWHRKYHKK